MRTMSNGTGGGGDLSSVAARLAWPGAAASAGTSKCGRMRSTQSCPFSTAVTAQRSRVSSAQRSLRFGAESSTTSTRTGGNSARWPAGEGGGGGDTVSREPTCGEGGLSAEEHGDSARALRSRTTNVRLGVFNAEDPVGVAAGSDCASFSSSVSSPAVIVGGIRAQLNGSASLFATIPTARWAASAAAAWGEVSARSVLEVDAGANSCSVRLRRLGLTLMLYWQLLVAG